jgi:hypothetical protein
MPDANIGAGEEDDKGCGCERELRNLRQRRG